MLHSSFLKIVLGFFVLSLLDHVGMIHTEKKQERNVPANDSPDKIYWGMRMRKVPVQERLIYDPVVIKPSPANESNVVRLMSGAIKMFYINKPGSADKLMSVSSRDNGITWSSPVKEFDLPGISYHANDVIEDRDGNLHCAFHVFGTGKNGYRGRQLNVWYCHTTDHGRDWTAPTKIFDGYVGSVRGLTALKRGRLLLAMARAVPSRVNKPPKNQTDYGWNDIITLYSDDNGNSWQTSNAIRIAVDGNKVTRYGGIEPAVIELEDGKVWMLIRTNKGCLYQSFSDDGGKTWQPPEPTRFISSDSPAMILRLADKRLLVFWCSDQRWDNPNSYANGGREVLHAAISSDEGKTWKGFREVLTAVPWDTASKGDRGTAYASAAETQDGKVIVVSGQGESRAVVILDPDWLEERSAGDDFQDGLVQWTLFGSRMTGPQSVIHDDDRKALFICKPGARYGDEAVWNFPMTAKGKLTLDIDRNAGNKGIRLALTDHFSVSCDSLAAQKGNVEFMLDSALPRRIRAEISWDIQQGKASLYINHKLFRESRLNRIPCWGMNYLRMGIPGSAPDQAGYFIRSVTIVPR